MEWISGLLSTLAIFGAAIFILVFIHELGHFLAAKFFGMRVDRFSIGFPPKVFAFRKGETEYVLGATPLGGYVKIAGMIDESMDTDFIDEEPDEDEFRSKPVWQRIIVILAGVIFNAILAFFIFTGLGWQYGETVFPVDSIDGIYVPEESLAREMGFQTGDRPIGVNGNRVEYFHQILNPSELTTREVSFMVERNGQTLHLDAPSDFLDRLNHEDFILLDYAIPSRISLVQEESPAERAGIEAGDRIVEINGAKTDYWLQIIEAIRNHEGEELNLTVNRKGELLSFTISPDPETQTIGIGAVNPVDAFNMQRLEYNLDEALVFGYRETGNTFTGIVQGLGKLFSGSISVRDNLGGPVAIANITKQATDRGGWEGFWRITAFLSVTLAIMNMLPIPALDGGHFMFLAYEGITRREPSAKVRMALQQIGFILLIGLIILVTFNDILRTFGS
ncbi:MAG: RIP metalloprotease RseP [Balneolaceae bacterium]